VKYKKNNLYTLKGQMGASTVTQVKVKYGNEEMTVVIAVGSNGVLMNAPHQLAALPCPPHCGNEGDGTELISFKQFKEEFEQLQ
jgi:hypothetical protein